MRYLLVLHESATLDTKITLFSKGYRTIFTSNLLSTLIAVENHQGSLEELISFSFIKEARYEDIGSFYKKKTS